MEVHFLCQKFYDGWLCFCQSVSCLGFTFLAPIVYAAASVGSAASVRSFMRLGSGVRVLSGSRVGVSVSVLGGTRLRSACSVRSSSTSIGVFTRFGTRLDGSSFDLERQGSLVHES